MISKVCQISWMINVYDVLAVLSRCLWNWVFVSQVVWFIDDMKVVNVEKIKSEVVGDG